MTPKISTADISALRDRLGIVAEAVDVGLVRQMAQSMVDGLNAFAALDGGAERSAEEDTSRG